MEEEDIEIIMPTIIDKYYGYIQTFQYKDVTKYRAHFILNEKTKDRKREEIKKIFYEYEAAFEWIKLKNAEGNNKKVKNIIYRRGNDYECSLGRGKKFLFDGDDIVLVQLHNWCLSGSDARRYAMAYIRGDSNKSVSFHFHTLLLGYPPDNQVTDHKDRNSLNNRKDNMRFVSRRINNINRDISSNKSGTKGVSWDKIQKAWCISFTNQEGKVEKKNFPIRKYGGDEIAKEEAIKYRKERELNDIDYKTALHYDEI